MPTFSRLSISLRRLAIVKNVVFGSDWQDYLVVELLYQFARVVESAIDVNGITFILLQPPRIDRNRCRTGLPYR